MGILPTAPHKPKSRMSDYVWLVYGPPGIGKTYFAHGWPKPLFLATEPGTAALEAADVAVNSWSDFTNVLDALVKEKHGYMTLVVDTVDTLYNHCSSHVCEANGWLDPQDGQYGAGWRAQGREWTAAISKLRSLSMTILFVSHERRDPIRELRGKKEIDTGRYYVTSALPNSARATLHGAVDFILRMSLEADGQRWLRTQPAETEREKVEATARGSLDRMLPATVLATFQELGRAFGAAFKPAPEPGKE